MKHKFLVATTLLLCGCVDPSYINNSAPTESVGTIRAVGGTVSYSRSNMQVSAESRIAERKYAQELADKNRPLNAMELDMIEQQKHELAEIDRMNKSQKERMCATQAAIINDHVSLTDFANGGLSYNEHHQRVKQLKYLQNHIYNKCMSN